MELVKRIRERGVTILMIEHVMKAIMNICDRIIVLHHGEKIAEGHAGGDCREQDGDRSILGRGRIAARYRMQSAGYRIAGCTTQRTETCFFVLNPET